MKKIIALCLALVMALGIAACSKGPELTCDGCGKKVIGEKNMTEDWIIFCSECDDIQLDDK